MEDVSVVTLAGCISRTRPLHVHCGTGALPSAIISSSKQCDRSRSVCCGRLSTLGRGIVLGICAKAFQPNRVLLKFCSLTESAVASKQ